MNSPRPVALLKHLRRALALLALPPGLCIVADANTLPNRPGVADRQYVLAIGTWSGNAVAERQLVAGVTNPALPLAGSQQLCVETIKDRVSGLVGATVWVDLAQQTNGSFAAWFANGPGDFPALDGTVLLSQAGLPSNWFQVTPQIGMTTSIYAWPGCADVFAPIVATRQFLLHRESTYEWAEYLNEGSENIGDACSGAFWDGPISVQETNVFDAGGAPGIGVWHHAAHLGLGGRTQGPEAWAVGGFADRMKSRYRIVGAIPTNHTPRGDAYHRAAGYSYGSETGWPTGYTIACGLVTTNTYEHFHLFQADASSTTLIDDKRYLASTYDTDFDAFSSCAMCTVSTNFGFFGDDCGGGPWYFADGLYAGGGCYDWSFGRPQESDNGYPQEINGFFMTATMLLRWNVPGGFAYVTNAPLP